MIPRVLIDTAPIPGGGGELRLVQRGDDFWIMLGANALMSTRLRGSEEALATLACERIAGRSRPAMLIGGLGMGFTLRAALAALPRDSELVVSELVPHQDSYEEMVRVGLSAAVGCELAGSGDRVVVTAGVPFDVPGTTNMMKVEVVP